MLELNKKNKNKSSNEMDVYLSRNHPSSYEWQEITHLGPQDDHVFAPKKCYAISMIIFFKTNFNLVIKYRDVLNKTYQP